MPPDDPVKVIAGADDVTLGPAANVMLCGVPGARLSVAGVAVTPVGSPDSDTATIPLNAFSAFATTEICAPGAPLVIVAEAGVTPSEKSGTGGVGVVGGVGGVGASLFCGFPHEMTARQQSWQARKAAYRPSEGLMQVGTVQPQIGSNCLTSQNTALSRQYRTKF